MKMVQIAQNDSKVKHQPNLFESINNIAAIYFIVSFVWDTVANGCVCCVAAVQPVLQWVMPVSFVFHHRLNFRAVAMRDFSAFRFIY